MLLKIYQLKTICKGDSHSSKTANIIRDKKVNTLTCKNEIVYEFKYIKVGLNNHLTEFECYISLVHVSVFKRVI